MEIINLSGCCKEDAKTAIALGNFDGIHIGHQELIKTMVLEAKKLGLKSSLLLFRSHTKSVIENNAPKMITNNDQKFRIAKELGVDLIYLLDFDDKVMKLTGEEFVKEIIINKMNGKLIIAGFDYRFGHKASGDANYLKELGDKYDIHVIILDPVEDNLNVVSSSMIRDLISEGKVELANKLLGRPYSIIGKVVTGSNRGSKLGFPTANIKLSNNFIIPRSGVYASNTIIDGKRFLSATNIGFNPTFDEKLLKIETYILDFEEDIYGKILEIEFIEFLRDDIKFNNVEDLIKQMDLDIENIRLKY